MMNLPLLYLALSIAIMKVNTFNDIENAEKIIVKAADEYQINEDLSDKLSNFKNSKTMGKTLVFTTKSNYHEHMISVDLQKKKENLLMEFYDAKSNDIKKEIKFDEQIMNLEAGALKELIFRMVERPDAKVNFKMIEELIIDILQIDTSLNHRYIVEKESVKIILQSAESIVAIFQILIEKQTLNEEIERNDFMLKINFSTYVAQNQLKTFDFKFSMFSPESIKEFSKQIKSLGPSKNYFNNLSEAAHILNEVVRSQGFKEIHEIKLDPVNGGDLHKLNISMKYNKSYLLAQLIYINTENSIGSYELNVFKNDDGYKKEINEGDEPIKQVTFTRQTKKELKEFFTELKLHELQNIYHKEVIEKFKQVYAQTFAKEYSTFSLKESIDEDNGNKFYKYFSKNKRTVKASVVSQNPENHKLCEFTYYENEEFITLSFNVPEFNIISDYKFQFDDYDFSFVGQYIQTIVESSYEYRALNSR